MSEKLRISETAVRLATLGLLSVALIGCTPERTMGTVTELPVAGEAPSGFPLETIISGVETFSTENPEDMSIPRSEFTDPVGEPLQNHSTGSVDGIPNPSGMTNVLVSGQEAWVPADDEGHPEPGYSALK